MTFGEWHEKNRPGERFREPKSSFAAWHEKEYGGGSSSAPAAPAADYSYDYDSRVKELEETKRQATVDMDFDTVNEIDKELKSMRAQEGKQTIGDRIGDVIGAASAGTVGAVADTVGTLWELAGGDPLDNPLADLAAVDRDRFTQSAKDGLGTVGQFLADTGIAGANLLTDAAVNALVPGAGLALSGTRGFGSAVREAEEDGASTQEKVLYGLGSAATGMLTEKLGNTGLLKSAYGSSLLKDPALGTLGKLAYSAVSEGAEEFAEGLADPLLKTLTYDPAAVYDDAWLNDTLYDSAVGAALGGLGGGVDVEPEQQKTTLPRVGEYNAAQPKNVEYPTVPIISMSRERYADSNGKVPDAGNALRTDAIRRARRRLQLDQNPAAYIPASNVTRNGEEYVLKVTKASLNKMLSPAKDKVIPLESILVLDNLERIANNGVWKRAEGDRKERQQIPGFDYLMTTVYVDNEPYVVNMRVRLVQEAPGKETDNVLYYFTPEEILSVKKAGA